MTDITNRNPAAEQLYRMTEELAATYPRDFSRLDKPVPDPVFKPKVQYYDSKVLISHEYPNMTYIRPYELEDIPSTASAAINASIEKNKTFFYGGTYHSVNRIDLWA